MGKRIVIRSHPINRGHRAQGAGVVVGTAIAHHANGAHGQDRDKGLPDLIIQPVFPNLVDVDRICFAQDV